ncbi:MULTISPECIES: nitroreductase family protein [Dehalobacter]|jgi:Nitroreductase|uniref:nitroreductase family protein n=1 Tax=Dehalobacter TaxID=56112 RepID=UPI00028B1383|nr:MULTISPECIES: nitroreductase family protein [unclassified Dehalobacter]AFV02263.1 putative nitroreductase [Dehalobacter sp. DCA]AFV05306.1 Nitroreductase family protein [Dehalobacter sp. CF]EQB22107.1 Nitroreductase family protein [Dehalobacter sp. UNSWDHB]MDJ0305770.1 nitroreductase family protein [Dehalobacter sp.]
MDFLNLVTNRRSVRKYTSEKVEAEKLQKILEAGRVAPSAHNSRPIKLIVVQSSSGLEKVKKAANIYSAPLVVIACGDHKEAAVKEDGKSMIDIDTSIVTDHMMLQATDLGLGTCWICAFDAAVLRTEFQMPENLEPINILAVGYAADEPITPENHDKRRKTLEKIVAYENL